MNADEYQGKALRTMAPQQTILDRLVKLGTKAVQADNAQRGLMDEVGELAAVQKKWVEYGGPEPDPVNILEEAGDVVWRVTQLLDAYGLKLEDALAFNIAKLAKRYPDAYSDHLAQEENRDRGAEYEALKGTDTERTDVPEHNIESLMRGAPGMPPLQENEKPGYVSPGAVAQDGHGFGHVG